jgi:hypothetical protein
MVDFCESYGPFHVPLQGSTLMVARLPGASEMRLRASENGTQLARWGKLKQRRISFVLGYLRMIL